MCRTLQSFRQYETGDGMPLWRVVSISHLVRMRHVPLAIVDLAKYSENEPVSIGSIAERQDISERYLEQLMAKLKKADLVKSIRKTIYA